MYVCVSERESEREWRERENKTSNIERNIKRDRLCFCEWERKRERQKRENKTRNIERNLKIERERQRQRDRDRATDRQTDRIGTVPALTESVRSKPKRPESLAS